MIVTEDDIGEGERSLLCLINARRGALSPQPSGALRLDVQLLFAARSHSADMVARNYFSHSSPEGSSPRTRATDAGYPTDVAVGEVIVRSAEDLTPGGLFQQIVASALDDELMLRPGFQTVGVGISLGTPGGTGITATVDLGVADTTAKDTAVDLFSRSSSPAG